MQATDNAILNGSTLSYGLHNGMMKSLAGGEQQWRIIHYGSSELEKNRYPMTGADQHRW